MKTLPIFAAAVLLGASCAHVQHDGAPTVHEGHGHDATIHHRFDDASAWSKVFDDEGRDAWQKPAAVLDVLGVREGQRVGDIGAGTGYFSVPLAKRVGAGGHVFAVDVEPNLVSHVKERAAKEGLAQLDAILAAPDDPHLPAGSVDLVLIVDTWHHIDDRVRYVGTLRRALAPSGRIAIIDFKPGEIPVGPPPAHRLPRGTIVDEFEEGGFALVADPDVLPYQFVLVFAPRPPR